MDNHTENADGEEYFEDDEMCGERDVTQKYFSGLLSRDKEERLKFLSNFSKCVKSWVAKPEDPAVQKMLKSHLLTALRMSVTAPYEDTREHLSGLLHEVQVSGVEQVDFMN